MDEPERNAKEQEARLLSYLEFEIKRIEEEQKRPGWTRWALGGTIASAVWLLLGQIETHGAQINPHNVLFLALALAVLWESLLSLKSLLLLGFPPARQKIRFFRTSLLAGGRLIFFSQIVSKASLLLVATSSPLLSKTGTGLLTCTLLGLSVLTPLCFLLASYGHFPVPMAVRPKYPSLVVWSNVLNLAVEVLILRHFALIMVSNWQHLAIAELRCAALIVVVFTIIPVFLSDRLFSPVVSILVELRRKLGLGQIDSETAQRQAEVLMYGEDALTAYITDSHSLLSRFQALTGAIDELAEQAQSELCASQMMSIASPRAEQMGKRISEISKALRSAQTDSDGLRFVNSLLDFLLPSFNELKIGIELIEKAEKTATQKLDTVKATLGPLLRNGRARSLVFAPF